MKVLIVEPRKRPREAEIDGSLESMQKTVGGYLQAIYPFEDEIALVCDDESKLKSDTEWNRMLPETGDIIKSTFFIAGLGAEDFTEDIYQKTAQILFEQYHRDGKVNPAQIINLFGEEDQSEIASLFHARIAKVETKADREKALKETILRVKQNSIREHSKHLDPTDMAGLQKIIADKKQLEKLEKTNISIP